MSLLGGNISARGEISPNTIRNAGAQFVRFVLLPDYDATVYIEALYSYGIDYLPVFARESWDGFVGDAADGLAYYAAFYGRLIHQIQVGNEPDASEGTSSWVMTPEDYSALLWEARRAFPHARIVTAGMVSGQASWLDGVDLSNADVVSAHPYAKPPGGPDLDWMLSQYAQRAQGRPLWLTEFDSRTRGMAAHLAQRTDVERAAVFCLHDYLDFGVLNRPDRLAEFRMAAGAQPAPPPPPSPEPSMPRFQQGFETFHNAMPDVIGDPIRDEFGAYPGQSSQPTKKGVLVWTTGMGMAFYERRGRVWRWADGAQQPEEVVA